MRARLLLPFAILAAAASAQIGDKADKPGEVQKSLVPRELIPPAPPLAPADALKSFRLAPGLRLELVAAEPLVQDPVAIQFGPDGRCWVAEMRGYMNDFDGSTEDQPTGRIVVLTDTDGDGVYDRSTVFLDNVILPRALLLVGDGLLVGAPPFLKFWRDTDGDGRADTATIVASDYGVQVDPKRPELANPERAPNSLLWALDNWIYSAAYVKKFRYVRGDFREGTTTFRGQWGLTQDDFGHLFHNSNSDQLRADVIPSRYLGRNPNYPRAAGANVLVPENQLVWPARVTPATNRAYRPEILRDGKLKEFTAACAPWIFRGDALGADFYGDAFVCEPAGNLIKRNRLTAPHGTLKAHEAYEKTEFLASTDERFRPVNLATGPDGALYVVDFHRGLIEHRISLTSYLRQQSEDRDLIKHQHMGRIYRVVRDGAPPAKKLPRLDRLDPSGLVAELSSPNSWRRETAQRLLVERADPALAEALRDLALRGESPHGRLHALCVLEGAGLADATTAFAALHDASAFVRTAAIRLCEPLLGVPAQKTIAIQRLLPLAADPAPEVQQQAVLTLGEARDPVVDLRLAHAVRAAPENVFLLDAFFSGLFERELPLLEKLLFDSAWSPTDPPAMTLLEGLARGVATSRQPAAVERLLGLAAGSGGARAAALLGGMTKAPNVTATKPLRLAKEPPALTALRNSGDKSLQAPLAKLAAALVWPGKPGAKPELVPPPLTAAEQRSFDAGRTLYLGTCGACHQPHGRGLEGLAPPLAESEWANGPASRVVRIALHGVRGPLKVDGRTYNLDMPPFGVLTDEQLAALSTYLRREWGNTGTPVSADQVRAIRAETAKRAEPWTQDELLKVP
ncbi:MAG: hypothetical protein RLZZ15_2653 [Verrucomicrobiota bacterium]|jgi:mono/diheme cytochrome c family protein/glucose/arabinose dehydrogenase